MAQQPLSQADAAALGDAFKNLQAGRVAEALAQAREVTARAPLAPDAHHLVALCLRRSGQNAEAARAFDQALALAPDHPQILVNAANLLRETSALDEAVVRYRRAITIHPSNHEAWMGLGLALLDQHVVPDAMTALKRAVDINPRASPAWHALSIGLRRIRDIPGARDALLKAVELAPGSGVALTALGVVERLLGDPASARQRYAAARALGYDAIELRDADAGAVLDLGDIEGALAKARSLVAAAPDYVAGHTLLSEILWQHGGAAGEDAFAQFRRAVAERPQHSALRLAFAQALLQAGHAEEALSHLQTLRREQVSPAFVLAETEALRRLERYNEAGALFDATLPRMGGTPHFRTAYSRHLLRTGKPDASAAQALLAAELEPADQEAYAVLSVAWRLLDDPREHWLCDYDRLVAYADIRPPERFADIGGYLAYLGETLTALHVANREPLSQSLRNGSQTSGNLFGRPDPVIAEAAEVLREARDRILAALPSDPTHPFLSRNTGRARYVGSWSVRLWSSGRHVDHFHPEGWHSSAFYVQLPPSVTAENSAEGAIQFGVPPEDLGLGLAPRRVVHPRPGRLVIFPSYMWHGTTPFEDAHVPRMTIAFDAQPV